MGKPLLALTEASLRAAPFFVLDGPDGRRLACQWVDWDPATRRAVSSDFEIICPDEPRAMGCRYGAFNGGEFRMLPAVRPVTPWKTESDDWIPAPEFNLDLSWRGDLNSVLDTGPDWSEGADGQLVICEEASDEDLVAAAEASFLPMAA